jgi:hypothetical protein
MDKLKETCDATKQFDIFTFTDARTELRTETSKAGKTYQRYTIHYTTAISNSYRQ